jgi:serine protease Do
MMHSKAIKPFVWLGVFILIVGLACSLSSSPTPTPQLATQLPQPTQPPAEPTDTQAPPTEAPSPTVEQKAGPVSSLEDLKSAVIQIESQGTFVNPDFSVSFNAAGRGSGFIIDPSGIAVTNNHVVTGAGLLKVWIGGDQSQTYNAKVLGVSECSDLAVIDIEGDGFPYLTWHSGPINVGLEVYAAGFPLGDPEFTLTKGIVSKEKASGETSWASVDYVIEHDATINPGNSGGPLVDASAGVVGVNYAGSSQTNQYYAIGRDLVSSVVDQLRTGKDLDTFGVNGEAFATSDFSGIWVYSVKSGSPADKAGIQGGDIITTLEDLVLATDGTMSDYCDILRSHNSGDVLKVQVLRYATSEVLYGEINGDKLQQVYSFQQALPTEASGSQTGSGYTSYVTVTDDTGAIKMDVPAEWTDINGSNWETDWGGQPFIAAAISASPDLNAYNNTYGESGVFFAASDRLSQIGGYVELLDGTKGWYENDCKYDSRNDYADSAYEGQYDIWIDCGSQNGTVLILSARPINNPTAFLILVEVKIVQDADIDALQQILNTFDVVGSLP